MEKISDTVTSLFRIDIKDGLPTACSSSDASIVWSETFGLGWRFGISYNPHEWFAKVRLYLDHNQSHTEKNQASVTVCLKASADKNAQGLKERVTTITDFGHGQPALLGSWFPSHLALHPYVSLTLCTKARFPDVVTDPLASTALALRESMASGDFVDTKFYVFSAKRRGNMAGKPRAVYANNDSIGMVLPESTIGVKRASGLASPFLVNMTGDNHINDDAVLHAYEYEQDSDLDDEEEQDDEGSCEDDDGEANFNASPVGRESFPGGYIPPAGSSSSSTSNAGTSAGRVPDDLAGGIPADPPAYSVSNCRMILVKGIAYRTWVSYIYFRYTSQVSFLPLKSAQSSSPRRRHSNLSQPPKCSPKSMYRLAVMLADERLQELAFRAIREGISKDNIIEEAFSWFTAQYPKVSEYEIGKVSGLRKEPEVVAALKLQMKAVTAGEKPWADMVLIAIAELLYQN